VEESVSQVETIHSMMPGTQFGYRGKLDDLY